MADNYQNIKFNKSDNVVEIVLDNPPVNIMTQAMMEEMISVLDNLIKDEDQHLLIFKAEGKHFSAGADVAEHTKDKCPEMIPVFMKLFYRINQIANPTIAIVQGSALGGGCELATFCDIVIASERAKFGQPEIMVGAIPPVAVAVFPHLIGRNKTLELLLTGEVITAHEAERIGLINKVFPEENFQEKSEEFISKLTSKSQVILKLTKLAIDSGLFISVDQALKGAEKIYLQQLLKTEDAYEGIQAFIEKRSPAWKGK
jgi:cyclohexa-1,5-dienecarbonyl-CoA hydratase